MQSVLRLTRVGDENSRANQKLREAVDGLVRYLATVFQQSDHMLPRNYYFAWWPSGEYELRKHDGTKHKNGLWSLTAHRKSRTNLFALADDIADGWLDEVSELLEQETTHIKQAVTKLNQLVNR